MLGDAGQGATRVRAGVKPPRRWRVPAHETIPGWGHGSNSDHAPLTREGGRARLIDSSLWRSFPWLKNIEERFHDAVGNHAYSASRRFGQVGNTSGYERTAIIHHDLDTALVLDIGDAHARAERQRSVRHG